MTEKKITNKSRGKRAIQLMWQAIRLTNGLVFFLGLAGLAFASGLTLYSYQDSSGQINVVSSLINVPPQYRDSVKTEFIPSFRGSPTEKMPEKAELETLPGNQPDNDFPEAVLNEVIDLTPGLKVKAPPPEIPLENPAVATATLLMEQLRLIQLNNERLHVQAVVRGLRHPIVRHLHLTNIKALQSLILPESIAWEEAGTWKTRAAVIVEQMRVLQYTLSRWVDSNSNAIIQAMPPLLGRLRMQINDLEIEFSKAIASETARLEKADEVQKKNPFKK